MRKLSFKILFLMFFSLFVSCNENRSAQTLMGTWVGKPESNCHDYGFSGGVVSVTFTFTNDTILKMEFTGSNTVDTSTVTLSDLRFAVEGDSLILISTDVPENRLSYFMEFENSNELILTRIYNSTIDNKTVDCKTVNTLKRI